MATSYTSLLGFALPVTGELSGTWGDVVNDSITQLVEDSVAGVATQSVTSGNWTLTTTGSGASNQARCAILIATGTPGVSRNIVAPSQSKAYIVSNQSDAVVVVKGAATTGASINAGQNALVAWNGSDFVLVASGDVDGPASSTNNAIATFSGTTGKIIQNNTSATITAGVITANGFVGPLTGTVGATTPSTGVFTDVTLNAQGDVRFADADSSNYVALQAPSTVASNVTWTLPNADGTANQVIKTDGAGNLGWGTPVTLDSPLTVVANASAGAEIRLPEDTDNGSNYVALKAPDNLSTSITLTLPSGVGGAGQTMQSDGSGGLFFGNTIATFGKGSVSTATGTTSIDIYAGDNTVYISNATADSDWTTNITYGSGTSLNSVMSVGNSLNVKLGQLVGGTPRKQVGLLIDGSTENINYSWIRTATGTTSTMNYYEFDVVKTGSAAYSIVLDYEGGSTPFYQTPGAPTGASATATSASGASVSWVAPSSTGGSPIIDYYVSSTPTTIPQQSTAGTSIAFGNMAYGSSYTFRVRARNIVGVGTASAASNSVSPVASAGQQAYTTPGTYTWIAPAGISTVSVVAVGGAAYYNPTNTGNISAGGGGGLGYKNNISVTPGSSYTVVVGDSVNGGPGQDSYFINTSTVKGGGGGAVGTDAVGPGGTYTGDGGGNGGAGGVSNYPSRYNGGGGGAGGYSGTGGAGGTNYNQGTNGAGGGGGGGKSAFDFGYGGGGVGILGSGPNGTATATVGNGGSSGANGSGASGGAYGGGGGGGTAGPGPSNGVGAGGAVRIIWAGDSGTTRAFPSTNTGNL